MTTRDGNFIVDSQIVGKQELKQQAKDRKMTLSGEMFFAVMNHQDHGVALGGHAAQPYYGGMFQKAEKISQIWGKPFGLKYLLYDVAIDPEAMNLRQTAGTLRVMNNIAPRNLLVHGQFDCPAHVVEHVAFLGGQDAVPKEFAQDVQAPANHAMAKKEKQIEEAAQQVEKLATDRLSDKEIVALGKRHKCPSIDKGYMLKTLEIHKEGLQSYKAAMEKDMAHDHVFLGGTVNGAYQNGVVERSRRYPTLLNFILTARDISLPELELTGENVNDYCLGTIKTTEPLPSHLLKTYTSANEIFDDFFNPKRLPYNMLEQKPPQTEIGNTIQQSKHIT